MPPLLASLFANESICKVGLAFKDDLHGLRRRRNFVPKNCVDIQSMVNQYGILELGLQKIFAICFGKKISKAQQLTNWEASKLTTEQTLYASTDAWATLLIYKELKATKSLPKKVTEALKREDIERQRQHQLEVMQSKCNNTYDNHSTQA
jgi:ribonuclease D